MIALGVALVGVGLLVDAVSGMEKKSGNSLQLAGVGFTLLILAALIVAIGFWKRSATEMAVTNRRVLVKLEAADPPLDRNHAFEDRERQR